MRALAKRTVQRLLESLPPNFNFIKSTVFHCLICVRTADITKDLINGSHFVCITGSANAPRRIYGMIATKHVRMNLKRPMLPTGPKLSTARTVISKKSYERRSNKNLPELQNTVRHRTGRLYVL